MSKDQAAGKGYHDGRTGQSREEPNGIFESFIHNNIPDHDRAMEENRIYHENYDKGQRDSSRK